MRPLLELWPQSCSSKRYCRDQQNLAQLPLQLAEAPQSTAPCSSQPSGWLPRAKQTAQQRCKPFTTLRQNYEYRLANVYQQEIDTRKHRVSRFYMGLANPL